MLLKFSALKALSLASIIGAAFSSPIDEATSKLDRRIVGNDAVSLICQSPNSEQCGLWVSYTNGKTRQSISVQSGGFYGCTYELLRKHTNNDGFWAEIKLWGGAGLNIGFNSRGTQMAVGDATWSSNDFEYLKRRCLNEFDWKYEIDTSASGESFFQGLWEELY